MLDRLPGELVWTADPRLSLAHPLGDWTFRTSAGVFHQGRWRATDPIPNGGSPGGTARRARHLVVGAEHRDGTRVESYAKAYDRYAAAGSGPQITAGSTLGVDVFRPWQAGDRLSGWLAYGLLRSRVTLDDGTVAPSKADVTHGLTAVGRVAIGQAWELGATARYATGRPITEVVGVLPGAAAGEPAQPLYGPLHGARLPDYRRLDSRLTRMGTLGGRRMVTFAEVLNLLGHTNVMGYTYDADYRERQSIESFFAHRVVMVGIELLIR